MVHRALLAVLLACTGISLVHAEPSAENLVSVPAGTLLHCRMAQTITTKLNFQGDAFTLSVTEPVNVSGHVAIPPGATLAGRITTIERPGRIKGVGRMRLVLDQITLPDGRSYPLSANLMAAFGADNVRVVGSEGLVKGPSSRFPDFEEIGAGTTGGALLGLIFAHPVVGATLGLTATTVDRLRRRGKDLTIPVGTELHYQLTRELALTPNGTRTTAANPAHPAGR